MWMHFFVSLTVNCGLLFVYNKSFCHVNTYIVCYYRGCRSGCDYYKHLRSKWLRGDEWREWELTVESSVCWQMPSGPMTRCIVTLQPCCGHRKHTQSNIYTPSFWFWSTSWPLSATCCHFVAFVCPPTNTIFSVLTFYTVCACFRVYLHTANTHTLTTSWQAKLSCV